jgi:hypothetical protein
MFYVRLYHFMGKLDIFPLMCTSDKVWITELTKILGQFVTRMRKFICQSDVKHIMSPMKKSQF